MQPWEIICLVVACLAAALAGTLIFLVKPDRRRDREPFEGGLFAHRGLHDGTAGVPENSLAAFRRARERGYGVELDVQVTADGRMVVFHDASLDRMTGGVCTGKVSELDYDEIKKYPLMGGEERVPLFSEVLETLGDTPVICEIKTHRSNTDVSMCSAVCDFIDGYAGSICIESFSPFVVRWFAKNRPDVFRGQLSTDFIRDGGLSFLPGLIMKNLLLNVIARPDFIAYRFDRTSLGLRLCRGLFRVMTVAWTVRSAQQLKTAEKKYDAWIFEGFIPEEP